MTRNPYKRIFELNENLQMFNFFASTSKLCERLYSAGYLGETLPEAAKVYYFGYSMDHALLMYSRYKKFTLDARTVLAMEERVS